MKVLFLVCLTAIVKKFVSITFHFSPVLPNEVETRFPTAWIAYFISFMNLSCRFWSSSLKKLKMCWGIQTLRIYPNSQPFQFSLDRNWEPLRKQNGMQLFVGAGTTVTNAKWICFEAQSRYLHPGSTLTKFLWKNWPEKFAHFLSCPQQSLTEQLPIRAHLELWLAKSGPRSQPHRSLRDDVPMSADLFHCTLSLAVRMCRREHGPFSHHRNPATAEWHHHLMIHHRSELIWSWL